MTAMVVSAGATAHEWYPRECCGKLDCAPVERVETMSDGSLRLTSRVGTTVVPASFPRRPSRDSRMHVCTVRYSHLDNMQPTCLFVPTNVLPAPGHVTTYMSDATPIARP